MQVDSPKKFSLYLYIPEGVPKSKVAFSLFFKKTLPVCKSNIGVAYFIM